MLANFLRSRKVINTCFRGTGNIFDNKMNEDRALLQFLSLPSPLFFMIDYDREFYGHSEKCINRPDNQQKEL